MNANSEHQTQQPQYQTPPPEMEREIDLRQIIGLVLQNKFTFLISILIACSITFVMVAKKPHIYDSKALIQVDNSVAGSNLLSDMNINPLSDKMGKAAPSQIQVALMDSPFILQPTVEKLHLDISSSPIYAPVIGPILAHRYKGVVPQQPLLGLNKYSWGGASIHLTKFTLPQGMIQSGFKVIATGSQHYKLLDAEGDQLLTGTVGQTAVANIPNVGSIKINIDKLIGLPGASFSVNKLPIESVLNGLSAQLQISDLGNSTDTGVLQLSMQGTDVLKTASILNTIVDFTIQKNIAKKSAEAAQTLNFLNKQVPQLKIDLQKAESKLNAYRSKSGTIDMTAEAKMLLTQAADLEKGFGTLQLQKQQLLQNFTADHPYIIAINKKQQLLQLQINAVKAKIRTLPETDQIAVGLTREVKVKSQLYSFLLNKIQQTEVSKAATISDVTQLQKATTPIIPLPSKKPIFMVGGFILGCFVAFLIAVLRMLKATQMLTPEQVEKQLGVPVQAIIPYSNEQHRLHELMKVGKYEHDGVILAKRKPKDLAVEGLRSLRTSLQFSQFDAKNNITAIIGSRPNVGKSFVSVNLAHLIADNGQRTLLIDADLRKGHLGKFLQRHKDPGLAEFLQGDTELKAIIQHSDNDKLDFIATGQYPHNPSELIGCQLLQDLLDTVSKEYDNVIIDLPPMLAVTDGMLVAKLAGTVLFLVGSENQHVKELELATGKFKKANIQISGIVFNLTDKSTQKSTRYGYSNYGNGGYGYNYYYDYDSEEKEVTS